MKKILFLLAFLPAIFGCEMLWNKGPTQLLEEIFKIVKIKNGSDLENAISQSTSKWIRPKFMASWHAYSLLDRKQRTELSDLLKRSDLTKGKMPRLKHYDAVVIIGCSATHVQNRINFLIKLHNLGITFDKIYLLGLRSDLKIGADADEKMAPTFNKEKAVLEKITKVEYLWHQTPKPESLKSIPFKSFKTRKDSGSTKTSTEAILELMLSDECAKGKNFLFISNSHNICYHDAMVKKALEPYEACIETVGDAMMQDETTEKALVSVAKCLFHMRR